MDKTEILRKAQAQQGADEMERHFQQQGSLIGIGVGLVVCVVLAVCKHVMYQPNWDVFCLYFSMVAARSFYKWKGMRQNWELITAIFSLAVAVYNGARYLWFLFG